MSKPSSIHEQQHLDRRVRDLYDHYVIEQLQHGRDRLYILKGERKTPINAPSVSTTQSARIRWRDQNRCQMCGRTVAEDHIRLHIDHKIPREWGGPTTDDNLWALCSTCNEGKRNYFATINDPRVQQAMLDPRVHVRLGELLKAFAGDPVPSQYLELVAYTHDDWQKRLRELRELGWQYHFTKQQDETGRVRVHFILDHWEPWPKDPVAAIRAAERQKGKNR